jgi:glutamate racemase
MNFSARIPTCNTASSISVRKMNARYLLMVQATLLPGTFHTRQVV